MLFLIDLKARYTISEFCLQTNILFNTNYLNLYLTIIVKILNINIIFWLNLELYKLVYSYLTRILAI